MRNHALRCLLSGACVALLAACGDGGRDDGSNVPDVQLETAGTGDPTRLQYTPAAGAEQTVEVSARLVLAMDDAGAPVPAAAAPVTRTPFVLRVISADAAAVRLRFTLGTTVFDAAGSDPASRDRAAADLALQDPRGLTGTLERGADGSVRAVDFPIPRGAGPTQRQLLGNLQQALQHLPVPRPQEPIADGAAWRLTRPVEVAGIRFTETATYTLVGRRGDDASVRATAVLAAVPQLIQLPAMPPGARCELLSAEGTADGTATVRADQPLPLRAEWNVRMRMRVRVRHEGESRELDGHVDMRFACTSP